MSEKKLQSSLLSIWDCLFMMALKRLTWEIFLKPFNLKPFIKPDISDHLKIDDFERCTQWPKNWKQDH